MNLPLNSAALANSTGPLRIALQWMASHAPLEDMMAVMHRSCVDPAVYVPAAMRLVFSKGPPQWQRLGLSTHETHLFAQTMGRVLDALQSMDAWSEPPLSDALRQSAETVETARMRRWLTIMVFGESVDYEPLAVVLALGRTEILHRLRVSIEAFRLASMIQ